LILIYIIFAYRYAFLLVKLKYYIKFKYIIIAILIRLINIIIKTSIIIIKRYYIILIRQKNNKNLNLYKGYIYI